MLRLLSLPIAFGLALVMAAPAFADRLPPEALDQQYQACMSKIAGNQDGIPLTAKQNYCGCVRDALANKWDTDKVATLAQQHQAAGTIFEADMADIDAIGRDCIAKSLK